ncbi:hypothetical protein O6H91_23G041900 [Diphasiastrum complanatum]|uniref:Uncharacterized protein n=1 Tax=Diphasiastrum complanatum TaxID=34168 RepID=A0ACC2A9X4_DIPCM|nr:hypothetical protein O6H91_23G041900 [Diphasiastrum complanatum]
MESVEQSILQSRLQDPIWELVTATKLFRPSLSLQSSKSVHR